MQGSFALRIFHLHTLRSPVCRLSQMSPNVAFPWYYAGLMGIVIAMRTHGTWGLRLLISN